MKVVKKRVDKINEELDGAMEYAEKYLVYKGTNSHWAQMYHDMSMQELNHAENLTIIAQDAMDELAYIPTEDDDMWKECQRKHAEKSAMIKLLLSK